MICNECGQELKNSATFCGYCGEKVEATQTASPPQTQQPFVNTANSSHAVSHASVQSAYTQHAAPQAAPNPAPRSSVRVKPKKGKKPIGIVCAIAVLAIIIGISSYCIFGGNDGITRAEWIQSLTDTMDYGNQNSNPAVFADVSPGHSVYESVQIAATYGLIDTLDEAFNPNAPATREFVAVTAAKAVGFFGMPTSELIDIFDLAEPHLIAFTVDNGLFESTNGRFNPNGRVSAAESEEILRKVLRFTTVIIDPDHINTVVYLDGVVDFLESFDAVVSADDNYMNVQLSAAYGSMLEVGTVYLLPPTCQFPVGAARRVRSITRSGDVYIVENVEAELEEIYQEISIQSEFFPDFDNIIWAEGVTVISSPAFNDSLRSYNDGFELQALANRPEHSNPIQPAIQADPILFKKIEHSFEIDTQMGLQVIGTWTQLEFDAVLNMNYTAGGFPLSAAVDIIERSSISWSVTCQSKPDEKIKLCDVPMFYFKGITIFFRVYLDLEGEFSVSYVQETTTRHWINVFNSGQASNSKILNSPMPSIEVDASFKLGLRPTLSLTIINIDLIEFSFFIGIRVLYARTLPEECMDIFLYVPLYVKIEVAPQSERVGASTTFYVFTEDNSPIRFFWHSENFIIVPECTRGGSSVTGTAPPGRPRGGYQQGPTVNIPCGEWQLRYIEAIQDMSRHWVSPREARLIFINDDNIPEIVIYDTRGRSGVLLTATNDRVSRIEFLSDTMLGFDYTLHIYERRNRFAYFEGVHIRLLGVPAVHNEKISEIQDGHFINLHDGDYWLGLRWDDQHIKEEEYYATRDLYFNYNLATNPIHSYYISVLHTHEEFIEFILSLCGEDCAPIPETPTPVPAQTPAPTPTQTPEPTPTPTPSSIGVTSGEWKQFYIDEINKLDQVLFSGRVYYQFRFINDDDIPELLLNFDGRTAILFTATDNSVASTGLHETNPFLAYYIERGNKFIISTGRMDDYTDYLYEIRDGRIILLHEGSRGSRDAGVPVIRDDFDYDRAKSHHDAGFHDSEFTANTREDLIDIIRRLD
jgi:hypothetical protein